MKIKLKVLLIVALDIIFLKLTGQIQNPGIPKVEYDVCPEEGCQLGEWIVLSPLKAFTYEGDSTFVAFDVVANEKITALRGNIHILKPGIASLPKLTRIISTDTTIITQRIDTAYVLVETGEGFADIWYQNRILRGVDQMIFKSIQDPETEWWVLFKNMDDKQGWLRIRSAEKRKIYGWNIFLPDSK